VIPEKYTRSLAALDENGWRKIGMDSLIKGMDRHKGWLIFLWVVAILAHAFDIFNFTLSIDDELHAQESGAKLAWAQQSRWGMYLLNQLVLPDTVFPVVPMLVAVTFIALAAHFLVALLTSQRSGGDYAAAALFIACPTLYFVLSFETLGYGVGIGWFCTTLAMYLFFCETGWKRLWAFPLLALSFGVYQSFMLAVVVIFELYLLAEILGLRYKGLRRDDITLRSFWWRVLRFGVLLGGSVLLYGLINKGYFWYFKFPVNEYLTGFIDVEWNVAYFNRAWQGIMDAFSGYYFGERAFYVTDIPELRWLFWASLVVTVLLVLLAPVAWTVKVMGLLVLTAMLFTPFLMNLMNGGFMPGRALLGIPLVIAGMALLASKTPFRLLRMVLVGLMIIVAFRFVVTNNRLAFSEYMTRVSDRELITQIMLRAGDVVTKFPDYADRRQPWPTILVGYHRFYESPTMFTRNSIGSSFFIWGGDIRRIVSVMRMMGYNDYRAATPPEHQKVMEYALQMPVWPAKGSVDVHDGVLIIKMEHYISHQLESGCAKTESNRVCKAFYECKRNKTMQYCERAMLTNEGDKK